MYYFIYKVCSSKLHLVNKIIHLQVVFDSLYLSPVIVSNTTGMAHLRVKTIQLCGVAGSTGTYCRNSDTTFSAVLSCDSGSGAQSSTSLNIKKRLVTTEYRRRQC